MKQKIVQFTLLAILVTALLVSLKLYFSERATSNRLRHNIETLQTKARQFTTRDGHQASKTDALILNTGELRKAFPEVTRSIKNMYIPPRLVESFTETQSVMKFSIAAATRDTMFQIPVIRGRVESAYETKSFSYADKWKVVYGVVFPDTTFVVCEAIDSIFTAIHRGERRHPWAWILSRRKLQVSASNRNPDIEITIIQGGVVQ